MKKLILFAFMSLLLVSTVFAIKQEFKLNGLQNALTKVDNEQARMRIQGNIIKLSNQSLSKLDKYIKVEFKEKNLKTFAYAETQGRFLGLFKMKHKHQYEVSEQGSLLRKQRVRDIFFIKDEIN